MNDAILSDPLILELMTLAEQTPEVAILWLYGSRARGTQRADSDYDLAVAFQSFIRDDPLESRLRPELLAMDWRRSLGLPENRLSVIDINQVGIALAYHVIQACEPLFCRDPRRLLSEENRVLSRMELDVLPYLPKKHDEQNLA
ncbi:MAG: nucleotidyltransferase domain-containing protein [Methylococcaceae bacterium]|nr:nucleotidyltransferase domain-containing protein [Methylococcaceae bacterium]